MVFQLYVVVEQTPLVVDLSWYYHFVRPLERVVVMALSATVVDLGKIVAEVAKTVAVGVVDVALEMMDQNSNLDSMMKMVAVIAAVLAEFLEQKNLVALVGQKVAVAQQEVVAVVECLKVAEDCQLEHVLKQLGKQSLDLEIDAAVEASEVVQSFAN